jgi:hypothetical protein
VSKDIPSDFSAGRRLPAEQSHVPRRFIIARLIIAIDYADGLEQNRDCLPRGHWDEPMVAKPKVSITAGEPRADSHGQFWSPATVTLTWPEAEKLPGPSVQVSLVAPIRGQMTVDELRHAHIQAAHDVLSAAVLSIEEVPETKTSNRQIVER